MSVLHLVTARWGQPVYSQAMGATAADGLVASFPLDATSTAKQIFIDAATADDAYNGLSPYPGFRMNGTGANFQYGATGQGAADTAYGPKKTWFAGYSLIGNSDAGRIGNQIFLAEGGVYTETSSTDSLNFKSGKSVAYPFCLQSYKPSDPLNLSLHGRATGAKRPTLGTFLTGGVGRTYGNIRFYVTDNPQAVPRGNFVFRGIVFDSGTDDSCVISWSGNAYNTLFENCIFAKCELDASLNDGLSNINNFVVRKCSFYGMTSNTAAHAVGIHTGKIDGLVIEDVVVWRGGWGLNDNRIEASFLAHASGTTLTLDSAVTGTPLAIGHEVNAANIGPITTISGGAGSSWTLSNANLGTVSSRAFQTRQGRSPDIYKHGLYIAYGGNQVIVRRAIVVDSSAGGLSGRTGMKAYHCVMIDNPVQMIAGGSVATFGSYLTESPGGVDINFHHNCILGGADINPFLPRMQGIEMQNGKPGSTVSHNLMANCPGYNGVNNSGISNYAYADTPSYLDVSNNVLFNWCPAAKFDNGRAGSAAFFPAQIFTTGRGNVNNLTSSPYLNSQLYSDMGYASKDAMMAAMVAAPEIDWAYMLLRKAAAGFNFDFALGG